jgi:hypothetical protein
MRNYWHVWYDLSYYSISATIKHIIFSFEGILETVWEPFDFFLYGMLRRLFDPRVPLMLLSRNLIISFSEAENQGNFLQISIKSLFHM